MPNVILGRVTADRIEPFAVFLIGMRINKPLRIDKWWPVFSAMPKLIKELEAKPELGFLGAHSWFGRTTIMLQYWNSFDQPEAYARGKDHLHLPAWRDFNQRLAAAGDVGIWHETYEVAPGRYECVYRNMPPFGLARATRLVAVGPAHEAARQRMLRYRAPVAPP